MQAYRSKMGGNFRVELDPQGDYARLEEGETLRASIMEDGRWNQNTFRKGFIPEA